MADNESNAEQLIHRVATHPNKVWALFYQLTMVRMTVTSNARASKQSGLHSIINYGPYVSLYVDTQASNLSGPHSYHTLVLLMWVVSKRSKH